MGIMKEHNETHWDIYVDKLANNIYNINIAINDMRVIANIIDNTIWHFQMQM